MRGKEGAYQRKQSKIGFFCTIIFTMGKKRLQKWQILCMVYCMVIGSELLQVQNFCSFQRCHFWKFSDLLSLYELFPKKIQVSPMKNFKSSWKMRLASSPWFQNRHSFENYKTFVSVEVQNPTMYSIILMEILQIWKLPLLKHNFLKVHSPSLNLNVMPFWDKYHRTCVFTDVTSIRSKLCATFIALLPYDLMLLLLNTTLQK